MPATPEQLARLAEPFAPQDVEWRVQQADEKNGKPWARVLAYLTNRAIMDRLDEVVGAGNWRNRYRPGPAGGVLCGLSILCAREGPSGPRAPEWVTKYDAAENTDVEPVKGGVSGAMKRAAVQWGMGRYLYDLDAGWAKIHEGGQFSAKTKSGTWFKWDPPDLPSWARPAAPVRPSAGRAASVPAGGAGRTSAAPAPVQSPAEPAADSASRLTDAEALAFPYPFHRDQPEHKQPLGTLPTPLLRQSLDGVEALRTAKRRPLAHEDFREAATRVLTLRGAEAAITGRAAAADVGGLVGGIVAGDRDARDDAARELRAGTPALPLNDGRPAAPRPLAAGAR